MAHFGSGKSKFAVDALLKVLVPGLPAWLIVPAAIMVIIIIAWPGVRQIWQDIIPSYRLYAREKMRLELLKLMCEVEAIRKKNDLPDFQDLLPSPFHQRVQPHKTAVEPSPARAPIKPLERWLLGGAGGFAVLVLAALYHALNNQSFFHILSMALGDWAFALGVLTGIALYVLFGGFLAWILKPTSQSQAFLHGIAAGAILLLIATSSLR